MLTPAELQERRLRAPALVREIVSVRVACERRRAWLDRMGEEYRPPFHCCPSCALGRRWSDVVKKQERALAWLAVLEGKFAALFPIAEAS